MYQALREREEQNRPLRIALVGCGAMGVGIAWQIRRTPGMELVVATDLDRGALQKTAAAYETPPTLWNRGEPRPSGAKLLLTEDAFYLEDGPELELDVLVEATNTIGFAGRVCQQALEAGLHVVLMNAEVDLALGPWLHEQAKSRHLVVTSDAGDQHGVLQRMLDEIQMWSFKPVMAGNVKGFLNRYATAKELEYEAKIRNLNPVQCCAYTDGTKLGVEMALVSNSTGMIPFRPGMEGPPAAHVNEVFSKFDFDRYGPEGVVDYVLGAEPGGGVFVVAHCEDPLQMEYLKYYKLGEGPFYLFYRPYHLCHLETPRAIARAALFGRPMLAPAHGRVADVYAYAKTDLEAGLEIEHGIGGNEFYGLIETCRESDPQGKVPIALLEAEGGSRPRLKRKMAKDQFLTLEDVALPETFLRQAFTEQQQVLTAEH